MSKLGEIIEGWKNNLYPAEKIREVIEEVHQERMKICNECPEISSKHNTPLRFDLHCTKCGCTLAAKTKSFKSGCPLDKWGPIEQ